MLRRDNLPPLDTIDARRICIIKPSALGDVVQTLPVLTAVRERFPRAHIAWVVNRSYAELLAGHPHLDEVIAVDRVRARPWSWSFWRSVGELHETLRDGRFDLVLDIQGLLRSGLMTWATAAARRVGLGDSREGSRLFYTDVVGVPEQITAAVDRYWEIAQALGASDRVKQFLVHTTDADREWAERQVKPLAGLRVAVNPGARWATKRWPVEHFAEIAGRLRRESGAGLVIVGGPEDVSAANQLAESLGDDCVNLAGKTTLKQLAAVLARVHFMVTNDSGPMHLAAALGTPVAALFTCTSPARARPHGDGHLVLSTNVWCAASYLKKCSRMACMDELTPDRVWPLVRAKIESLRRSLAA